MRYRKSCFHVLFRKVCVIDFEQKAFNESVEICNTPLVKDCNIPGPEENLERNVSFHYHNVPKILVCDWSDLCYLIKGIKGIVPPYATINC